MEGLIDQFHSIVKDFRLKRHDLLAYHNNKFDRDYVEFNVKISDLECSLQASAVCARIPFHELPEFTPLLCTSEQEIGSLWWKMTNHLMGVYSTGGIVRGINNYNGDEDDNNGDNSDRDDNDDDNKNDDISGNKHRNNKTNRNDGSKTATTIIVI